MSEIPLAGGAINITSADEQTIAADITAESEADTTAEIAAEATARDTAIGVETARATAAEGVLTTAVGTKVTLVAAPSTATSAGIAGQVAYDATHWYVCVATNTWVRVVTATF